MGFTEADYHAMVARTERGMRSDSNATRHEGCEREVGRNGLHQQIMDYCDSQWPRWKYIHSRTDRKSTVAVGVHDFTIYCPCGKVLNIECKTRTGKLTEEQLCWIKELEIQGHTVHVVRSLEEFIEIYRRTYFPK